MYKSKQSQMVFKEYVCVCVIIYIYCKSISIEIHFIYVKR